MATTTKEFISHIGKHGLASPNRFQIIIPLPNGLQRLTNSTDQERSSSFRGAEVIQQVASFFGAGNTEVTRGLDVMAEETSLPGRNITTTSIKYNSDFHQMPYSVVYDNQQFVFKCSGDMYEKDIIDTWMEYIYDPVTHEIRYMTEYATDVVINQLDKQDNIVYSIILKDAFPSLCEPMGVAHESTDTYHRLGVTFSYRRWERAQNQDGGSGLVDQLSQTPLAPYTNVILSNPAVQRGLEIFESNTGIDLEGEAVNVYNQVDGIVKDTTGESIKKSISLIEGIRASTEINDRISNDQKAKIIDIIDQTLGGLRS